MRTETSPPGRRVSFIEEARRAQLVECAIDAIAELGFSQASVAEIARRAGVSKSVITYYFSSKEQLIREVLTRILTDAARYIAPRVGAETTVRLRLQAYIRTHIEYISAHLKEMVAVMEIAANHRSFEGKPIFGVAEQPVLKALGGMLARGQQAGEFGEFDCRVMALAIRRSIDALPPLLIADPDAFDPEAYASEVVALFDRATRKEADG